MKYDIILLDADETLFDFDMSEYNALKCTFEKHSLPFSNDIYDRYHEINKSLWRELEKGRITKPELLTERFRRLINSSGLNDDAAGLNKDYCGFLGEQCILFPGAESLCRELSESARLYIVTNGVMQTQMKRYAASPFPKYISGIFVSEQIGYAKPDKQYFDAVFSKIPDFDPSRTIIIGDSLSSDIRGGNNAKIASCWYNPHLIPNDTDVIPTYQARDYSDIIRIVKGNTGRPSPHPASPVICKYEHTGRNALVLLPADKVLRSRFRKAAPDFSFTFANSQDSSVIERLSSKSEIVIGGAPVNALKKSDSLRLLQLCTAGTEPYSIRGELPDNVIITNATGAFGLAVSEHMLAALLCLYKKLHLYRDNMRTCSWADRGEVRTLKDAVVLTVGLGDIGGRFAKMCHMLGAYTVGVRRTDKDKPDFIDELVLSDKLDSVLPRADVTALVLPATDETNGLMSEERIFSMKKGSVLLNAGRGNAVDTNALCKALKCGQLSGASIDVSDPEPLPPEHPLWKCRDMLITPHVSGYYHLKNTYLNIAELCVENVYRYAHNLELLSIVDRSTGYAGKK